MKTNVDTCLNAIADWYIKNRREITPAEIEPILSKHCQGEKEVEKFYKFLETEPGKMRFKTLLRERKGGSSTPASYLKAVEPAGKFTIRKDRSGNVIVNHSSRPKRDVVLQFGKDEVPPSSICKEIVLEILSESEQKELDAGSTLEVSSNEPRASTLKELWERATARDYDIPTTKVYGVDIEAPVAKAVEALAGEDPISSGFHGALNQRWTIVFKGKISDRAVNAARVAGLEVSYRQEPKRIVQIFTDVSLPGVGVSEIQKATKVFNRFAELYEGTLLGAYRYQEEAQARTAKSYAEGLGYSANLQYRGGEWELTISNPNYLKEAQKPQSGPIIHEATTENPDPAEFMPIEVTSAFPSGDPSHLTPSEKAQIDRLIEEVPDKNDTGAINYWSAMGDKEVYLEGWIDKCLTGTGFPTMEGGEWDEKIQYMIRDMHRVLLEKQEERNRPQAIGPGFFRLIEGGFREFEAGEKEWLYGVTWGVYEKPKPQAKPQPSYLKQVPPETECQIISPQYYDILTWLNVPVPDYSFAIEPEVKERKIDEVLQKLKDGVSRIHESAIFREFLTTMAKFWDYSIGNQILIMLQRRDATRVAGFMTWKDVGRYVRAGERGIAILAPCLPPTQLKCPICDRVFTEKTLRTHMSEFHQRVDVSELIKLAKGEAEPIGIIPTYFKVVHVFDVSQTEGKPLPEIAVPVLTGAYNEDLFNRLMKLATKHSLTVSFEPMPGLSPEIKGSLLGKSIWVKGDEPEAQRLKTLGHELAHYFTEHVYFVPRADAEVIAESVAFTVCAHFGFDTGIRSFPYVALWAKEKKVLEQNLANIRKISGRMIEELE